MSDRSGPALASLRVADEPQAWERLGFAVHDGLVVLGGTAIALEGPHAGEGIVEWTLAGAGAGDLDGLPTRWIDDDVRPDGSPPSDGHPNGAVRLDHVVVMAPDLDRTLGALTGAGLEVRRVRETGTPQRPVRQGFLWVGDVLLEVVGDVPHDEPGARFWGLVAVVPDVDALATQLGPELVGAPKDAVQPGRRILTVRREAGLSVPLAFLTPHVRS